MKRSVFLAFFSAILSILAHANPFFLEGIPLLSFFYLIPLFLAWIICSSLNQAIIIGSIYSFFSTLGQNFWLAFFGDFSLFTLGGPVIGYTIMFSIFSFLVWNLLKSKVPYKPFLLAFFWTTYEITKSTGFLGYPWGLIFQPLHSFLIFIQIVDTIGTFGLSFFIALINSALAFLIAKKDSLFAKRALKVTILSYTIFIIYGMFCLYSKVEPNSYLSTLIVQVNEDPWREDGEFKALETSIKLTEESLSINPDIELVIWSETLLKRLYFSSLYENFPFDKSLHSLTSTYPIHWLIGAPTLSIKEVSDKNEKIIREKISHMKLFIETDTNSLNWKEIYKSAPFSRDYYEPYNSILFINPKGIIEKTYSKSKLVPFAENVPFQGISLFSWAYEKIGISALWKIGEEDPLAYLKNHENQIICLGLLICFEDAFDLIARKAVLRGADILINLTNDSWSKTYSAEWQHHIVAKFRAIENRRTLIRSTNSGVSSIIDPWGRILDSLPLFEEGSLAYLVPIYNKNTSLFTKGGDWFIILLSVLVVRVFIRSRY